MKRLIALFVSCFILAVSILPSSSSLPAQVPPAKAGPRAITHQYPNPAVKGGHITTVNREQLRLKNGKTFHKPVLKHERLKLPPAPTAAVNWSLNNNWSIVPILGNDEYGDCYAAAGSHWFSVSSANSLGVANADVFNAQTLITWYLKQSGGDNGLSDSDVLPNMEKGWIPAAGNTSAGTHKTLDYLIVDSTNLADLQLGMSLFGPSIWTCSLLNTWLNNEGPNATWTNAGTANPDAGHAMVLNYIGVGSTNPMLQTLTWGYGNNVTWEGIQAADSEIILCFSPEWFNAQGYAPNGMHYTVLSPYWTSFGGKILPPSPYPPPTPTPTSPVITQQPSNITITAGTAATFTIMVTGDPTPTIQWQSAPAGTTTFTNITGATSASLIVPNGVTGTQYKAIVTNSAGSVTSQAAVLTITNAPTPNTGPVVTQQPANITIATGGTATFTALATGNPTPNVQWQSAPPGTNIFSSIAGATSTSLIVSNGINGTQYQAIFTNTAGTVTTQAATLTITSVPTPASGTVTIGMNNRNLNVNYGTNTISVPAGESWTIDGANSLDLSKLSTKDQALIQKIFNDIMTQNATKKP